MTTKSNTHIPINEPLHISVKLYNIIILLVDISLLLARWIYITIIAIIRIIIPIAEVSVKGELILITGTGHGIGRELALQYSKLGGKIICIDINEKGNAETVKEIKDWGGIAYTFVCDVTNREQVFEMSRKIKRDLGTVNILINNAGIMPTHSILQHTEMEIRKIFEVNVYAHCWIIQAFLNDMIENNRGHIVALSSIAGLCGLKNLVPYCGSKFAVRGMMEALEEEIRCDPRSPQIKFTTVYPYMANTGLCKRPHMRFTNLMRLLEPNEVAAGIIQAQRRGVDNLSIPSYLRYTEVYARLFPHKCGQLLADFLDSGVESDL